MTIDTSHAATATSFDPEYQMMTPWEKSVHDITALFHKYPTALTVYGAVGMVAFAVAPMGALGYVGLGVSLGTLCKVAYQWRRFLMGNVVVPLMSLTSKRYHDGMDTPMFTPRKCWFNDEATGERKLLAQLEYRENHGKRVPYLLLTTNDPVQMGVAEAYMMAPQIMQLQDLLLEPMISLLTISSGDFFGKEIQNSLGTLKFEERFTDEIFGVTKGLKDYCRKAGIDDVLVDSDDEDEKIVMFHKMASMTDVYKRVLCQDLLGIKGFNLLGCTTVAIRRKGELCIGSQLDWMSLGVIGQYMFLRHHPASDGVTIESVTFPGYVGATRAHRLDKQGLTLIVNEAHTHKNPYGIPYNLFVMKLIESCTSVKEVRDTMSRLSNIDDPTMHPASSFLLIVADCDDTLVYQMTPGEGSEELYTIREMTPFDQETSYLIVTNDMRNQEGVIEDRESISDGTTERRYREAYEFLTSGILGDEDLSLDSIMGNLLALPSINRPVTLASTIFHNNDLNFAFDNYWATDHFADSLVNR